MAAIETREWLTTAEAADILGVSVDAVTNYCLNFTHGRTPALEARKFGHFWMVHKKEVARYLRERRYPGRPPNDS